MTFLPRPLFQILPTLPRLPAGHFGVVGTTLIGGRFLLRDALLDISPDITNSLLLLRGTFIG